MRYPFAKAMIPALLAASLSGCLSLGPRSIETGRVQFNKAINESSSEQLLLNLVRLHYRELPYMLEVASVSQSMETNLSSSGSGTFPAVAPNTYGLGLGLGISSKPTVTYTPLQGEQFVRQMLTPISMERIALLLNSGWSISRTMRLVVQEINGLPNAPSASGPTPANEPQYREFLRVAHLLRELEIARQVSIVYAEDEVGELRLSLAFADKALETEAAKEVYSLLNLNTNVRTFALGTTASSTSIRVLPRTMSGCLFYLSQAVETPNHHRLEGNATQTLSADGTPFDWQEVMGDFMHIRNRSPWRGAPDARIKVYYDGRWYYIDDSDLNSRSTFLLTQLLLSLQAGENKSTGPLLTLPVAR